MSEFPATMIKLKSGKFYINYPLKGDNLFGAESIKEFLKEHKIYFLKTANNKEVEININDVDELVDIKK